MKAKNIICCMASVLMSLSANAIPAKPGMWQQLQTTDGLMVTVELVGDEHLHFYRDSLGNRYQMNSEQKLAKYTEETFERLMRGHRMPRKESLVPDDYVFPKPQSLFKGEKRGLVILVEFSNNKFSIDDPQATYNSIANEPGYCEGNFKKSVRDYFLEQSDGEFDLTFDVVGPVKLANNMSYYGGNNEYGNDQRPGEMIVEACQAVDGDVDFSQYDWDGDGEVDQVFVVYAGYGEADGAATTTIWPHEWDLYDAIGETITLDGTVINTYACGNELDGTRGQKLAGIGVFCHEFSHCMGFPDFYDKYNFGMGAWDVMSNGARNGGGYNPAEYSAYERMICGWRQPIVLDQPTEVKGMKPVTDGGDTYIIYCDNEDKNEYYLLENKSKNDIYPYNYSGRGLLITHVDYDKEMWYHNIPNTTATYIRTDGSRGYNTHQRMTIIAADNSTKALGGYITDVYPIDETTSSTLDPNNSLTVNSTPAATQYNGGDEPVPFEGCEITDIVRNSDGTIDFWFRRSLATAISNHPTSITQHQYYDLGGNRLGSVPTRRGIYIRVNGTTGKAEKVVM